MRRFSVRLVLPIIEARGVRLLLVTRPVKPQEPDVFPRISAYVDRIPPKPYIDVSDDNDGSGS